MELESTQPFNINKYQECLLRESPSAGSVPGEEKEILPAKILYTKSERLPLMLQSEKANLYNRQIMVVLRQT
jgi:hypothetical protein